MEKQASQGEGTGPISGQEMIVTFPRERGACKGKGAMCSDFMISRRGWIIGELLFHASAKLVLQTDHRVLLLFLDVCSEHVRAPHHF